MTIFFLSSILIHLSHFPPWCVSLSRRFFTIFLFLPQVGEGKPSENLRTRTSGGVPQPGALTGALTANVSWATLGLGAWSDGGCPITRYTLAYRRADDEAWVMGEWATRDLLI